MTAANERERARRTAGDVARRVGRWLGGIAIGLVALVVGLVLLVLIVAWVPAASQLVARLALDRWDASMPGSVQWQQMRGSIGAGLTIDGFALDDAQAQPLVHAEQLLLDLDVARLFVAELSLERAQLHEVAVWVDHAFGDLAAPSEQPPPERVGYGPDLPIEVHANVLIDGGVVLRDEQIEARLEWLALEAAGVERRARVELHVIGLELPREQLGVDALGLAARWDEPVATLEWLAVDSPLGSVEVLDPARFDVSTLDGALAVELRPDIDAIVDRFLGGALPDIGRLDEIEQASVRVRGRGGPEWLALAAEAELDDGTRLKLQAEGRPTPTDSGRRSVSARLDAHLAPGLLHAQQGLLRVSTTLALAHAPGRVDAEAKLRVTDVEQRERVALGLVATGSSLAPPRGTAWVELRGPALSGSFELASAESRALSAAGSLHVREIGEPLELLAPYLDVPRLAELRGALSLGGRCASAPGLELDTLDCSVALELDEVAGYDTQLGHAQLDARIWPLRQPLGLHARLELDELRRADFAVDELTLLAGGTTEALTVALHGHGPTEAVALAAELHRHAQTLTLALDELLLLSQRGGLTHRIELLEPTRIVVAPERVEVHELVVHAGGGRIEIDGRLGLGGPVREADGELRVAIRDVDLARVAPLVPGPAMRGRIDLHGHLHGRLQQPEGWVQVDVDALAIGPLNIGELNHALASGLVLDHTELGALSLHASLDQQQLGIDLDYEPGFASVELDAELPLTLDLASGELDWDRSAPHLIALELRDLDLHALQQTLAPQLPALAEVELAGQLSASLLARGNVGAPSLHAELHACNLTHRGEPLGQAWLQLDHDQEGEPRTTASIALDSPLADRLDAQVELPLRLELGDWPPTLDLDTAAPLRGEAHVQQAELAALEPHLDIALPIAGRVGLDLELGGSLAQPELMLTGRMAELHHDDDLLGDLIILARVADSRLRVDADLLRRGTHLLAAAFELPLTIALDDLESPQIGWDAQGRHLVSVTGRGLDGELLAALTGGRLQIAGDEQAPVGTPELDTQLQIDVVGGGRLSSFSLAASLHGELLADDDTSLIVDASIDVDERRQTIELTLAPVSGDPLALHGRLAADPAKLVAGEQAVADIPFELRLHAPRFELDTLAPLLATQLHGPDGTLHVDLSGRGSLGAPELDGELRVRDGELTVLAMRQQFRDIDLELNMTSSRVELNSLTLASGRGRVDGRGQAEFGRERGIEGELELSLRDIPIVRPGLPAMAIGGRINLDFARRDQTTQLRVDLADGEITVAGINPSPPKSVPSHAAVEFVGAEPTKLAHETETLSEAVSVPESARTFVLQFELGDPLLISGPMIDMAWRGAVELRQRGAAIELDGELEAARGRLELLGHRFDLRRGIVTLPADGSLDPFLDIVAETTTPEAEITVTFRGRATEPTMIFSSNPPMSDIEILTLLVTGSTQIEGAEGEVESKAASLLAAVSSPQLQRQLDRYLGIDRVQIGFGEAINQPILSLGKRITRDVYVETTYHHNAPEDENTAEIAVEYQLAPHWSLESYFGDAAVGGVGVYWTRSFGIVPWRSRQDAR